MSKHLTLEDEKGSQGEFVEYAQGETTPTLEESEAQQVNEKALLRKVYVISIS
jgi:hypothetical protein